MPGLISSKYILKIAGLTILGLIGSAQAQTERRTAIAIPDSPPTDDVVVTGLRDLDLNDPAAPVTHQTLGSNRTGTGAIASNSIFELSERFAKCAITPKLENQPTAIAALRRALDGTINGAAQRFWQARFISIKSVCAQNPQIARESGLATINALYDTSYYDRGAMYIWALQTFAHKLSMTKKQTTDPTVQQRFNTREIPLARYRLPLDRLYFETAVCLVRMEPDLSLRACTNAKQSKNYTVRSGDSRSQPALRRWR